MICTLILSSMVAFGLSRFRFRGSLFLLMLFTAGNLLPQQVLITPLFRLYLKIPLPMWMSDSGTLYDSYWGIILIHVAFQIGFCTFVLTNYMKTLPGELTEAAMVDGASVWRQYYGIVLPLCRAPFAALATLEFTWIYNDFFWALALIHTGDKQPITSALNSPQGPVLHQQQPGRRRRPADRHPHPDRLLRPAAPVRRRPHRRRHQGLTRPAPP